MLSAGVNLVIITLLLAGLRWRWRAVRRPRFDPAAVAVAAGAALMAAGVILLVASIVPTPVYGPTAVIEFRKLDGQALGAVMLSAGVNLVIITLLLAGLRDSLREARRGHGTSTAKAGK
jgi:hypothetical protein